MGIRILSVVLAVVVAVICGIGGYVYGTGVGEARASSVRQQFFADRTAPGGAGGGAAQFQQGGAAAAAGQGGGAGSNFGGATTGEIKSINGNEINVSTRDAIIKVMVNDQTQITQSKTAKVSDLAVGERITVIPDNPTNTTASPNQSITARIIQAGDARGFFGGQPTGGQGRQGGQQGSGSGQ